MNLCNCKTKFA